MRWSWSWPSPCRACRTPLRRQRPDRIVYVAGKQYAFALSETPIGSAQDWEEANYSQSVEVPLGSLVEFRVGTLDVNHGFSLYSPEGGLVAQTQAMPGYEIGRASCRERV